MGWMTQALRLGTLRVTEHRSCPFCQKRRPNACKTHGWAYKKWIDHRLSGANKGE